MDKLTTSYSGVAQFVCRLELVFLGSDQLYQKMEVGCEAGLQVKTKEVKHFVGQTNYKEKEIGRRYWNRKADKN